MSMKKVLYWIYFLCIVLSGVSLYADSTTDYKPYAIDKEYQAGYIDYQNKNDNKKIGEDYISIDGNDYSSADDKSMKVEGKSLITSEVSSIEYKFTIDKEGLYNIGLDYTPIPGKGMEIIRTLKLDGEVPFEEANALTIKRLWKNSTEIQQVDGNDLQPLQVESYHSETIMFEDDDRMANEPFKFYLTEGEHTITLDAVQEPLQINQLLITKPLEIKTYDQYQTKNNNLKETSGHNIVIEGEAASIKSNAMLAPDFNYTSSSVTPNDAYKKRINVIGGKKWDNPGDFIEWEVEVPESGLYNISFKVLQNYERGLYSNRRLTINGQVPFEQAKTIKFNYNKDVQTVTAGDNDEQPYLFALEKGSNIIRLENVPGNLGETIYELEQANMMLNDIYKDVIMIAGTSPDVYRDYNIENSVDNFEDNITTLIYNLTIIKEELETDLGEKSDVTANIDKIILQLNAIAEEPDNIIKQLNAFKSNISALPNTIRNIKEQELAIDSIYITSSDTAIEETSSGFDQFIFSVNRFLSSFVNNNEVATSAVEGDGETIEVWVTRGQDELQVWRSLIDNNFTPQSGINVDLKLVGPTAILPAVLSGEGPDVGMYLAQDVPVNYATRNAVVDLSQFSDYDKVSQQYYQSAITPFEYNGGIYALGEEQKFPMLFYRTDIFDELGLEVPQTWNEMFELLPVLSSNNMELMLEPTVISNTGQVVPNIIFSSILYQNGGEYYKNNDMESALTDPEGVAAFDMYTKFYTNYSVDIQADFANRFKTGEVPIGIMDYTQYNQISIFAPELAGMWSVAPVPGIDYDGTINNATASTTSGMVMFKDTDKENASWEFMKWATSDATQINYGKEIEAKVGRAGRWQSANKNAMERSSYPTADLNQILNQQKHTSGVPQVPGGYITGRQIDYAFRKVVNDNQNPYEVIFEYTIPINNELTTKRKEFELEYIDGGVDEESN